MVAQDVSIPREPLRPGRISEFTTPRSPLFLLTPDLRQIDFAAAPISRCDWTRAPGGGVEDRHRIPRTLAVGSELFTTERNAPMSCPSCYWQHTDIQTALTCYRKSNPLPTENRPRGDRVNKGPETGRPGVDTGSPKRPSSLSTNPGTLKTVFRHGRAGKSGRPRVSAVEQRRKARERSRAHRARLLLVTRRIRDSPAHEERCLEHG
jgi:hypothetical protein